MDDLTTTSMPPSTTTTTGVELSDDVMIINSAFGSPRVTVFNTLTEDITSVEYSFEPNTQVYHRYNFIHCGNENKSFDIKLRRDI